MTTADDEREGRRAVVRKYARWQNGSPCFCGPSRLEMEGRNTFHAQPNGKVIYNDRETAEKAAAELLAITGINFRPYQCPRSRRGHHHLTRDNSPAVRRAQQDARIQQRRHQ